MSILKYYDIYYMTLSYSFLRVQKLRFIKINLLPIMRVKISTDFYLFLCPNGETSPNSGSLRLLNKINGLKHNMDQSRTIYWVLND